MRKIVRANLKMPPGYEGLQGTFDTLMRYIDQLGVNRGISLIPDYGSSNDPTTARANPYNTTADCAVFSHEFLASMLPAEPALNSVVRITTAGQILNNTGANRNCTLRQVLGDSLATTTVFKTTLTLAPSANPRAYVWVMNLMRYIDRLDQTHKYAMNGHIHVAGINAVADEGSMDVGGYDTTVDSNTSALSAVMLSQPVKAFDGTSVVWQMKVQLSFASTSFWWNQNYSVIELLGSAIQLDQ